MPGPRTNAKETDGISGYGRERAEGAGDALGRIHKESHQYIDIVKNFATVTKWNTRIEIPDVVSEVVRKAFKVAEAEKPGSVHLELPENVAAERVGSVDSRPVRPQRVLYALRKVLGPDDIVISDVGMHKMWVAKFYPVYGNNTLLISNGFASMGFAFPAAIAAKLTYPGKKVAAVCGDGGFLMNVQEMETASRLGLNVVVVIFNDCGYELIKWKSVHKFGSCKWLDFTNPDFVRLAESFGAHGFSVRSSEGLEEVLADAFTRKGPVVVDVQIDYTDGASLARLL